MSYSGVFKKRSYSLGFSCVSKKRGYRSAIAAFFVVMVQRMGGMSIKLFSDSRLVVGQVKGEFEVKDERMQGYLSQVKCLQ